MITKSIFFNLYFIIVLSLLCLLVVSSDAQGLKVGYYKTTCPNAEAIIHQEMKDIITMVPSLAAPLLRMHFHDCFVNGCDASVLLNGTAGNPSEKDGVPNQSLRGYGVIDRVKDQLEKACPGIVSCADILAVVARDVVGLTGGPYWEVATGRRDGFRSVASDTLKNLPPPAYKVDQILNQYFIPKGLDAKDLVVLSGAHTIGIAHCSSFSNRLYNFDGQGNPDPLMNHKYLGHLRDKCKPYDAYTFAEMDPGSFRTFDTSYYKRVAKMKTLFTSDQDLVMDSRTRDYVLRQAAGSQEFLRDFGNSMIKMANIEVLTGHEGEVRKKCSCVN